MNDKLILTQVPLDDIISAVRNIIREEIAAFNNVSNAEKMLSPIEVCKLFNPNISRVTLNTWTKNGLIQSNRIGGRVYYKQSDVLTAVKTLKRYKKGGIGS